jgi:hypothetical protein
MATGSSPDQEDRMADDNENLVYIRPDSPGSGIRG